MRQITPFIAVAACLLAGLPARAVKIADITRIDGQRTNTMTGMGLVVGLNGSGDGGEYLPAIRALSTMLEKFHDPVVSIKDLAAASNIAIVSITATIPKDGVHKGDALDVFVMSNGAAKSLKNGVLYMTPMTGPLGGESIHALAHGQVNLLDPSSTNSGVITKGAVMERDFFMTYVTDGKLTLILEDPAADWTNASTIAKVINDAMNDRGETLAVVRDPKTIEVTIPPAERERPDSFISNVQRLPVPMLPTEARVTINVASHTMILTGDVEITPVVVSYQGLTISTLSPPAEGTKANPLVTNKNFVSVGTTGGNRAKMEDLVAALDQLKVPADDRIKIIKELYKSGSLHAKLIVE